ncbi:unnamed protein product [Nyctereutes procyonoides]|uniref:(raccoon dog) hypothetical protein n=1 Tax=Nyctereutes procyonoides TaxID=34880 RepID=A0A811YKT6_NYCPR|nr:unnamed protein product [Nyctereutes procyonoides]
MNMKVPTQLLGLLLLWLSGASSEIQRTQSPTSLSVSPGDRVTITCQASQNSNSWLIWPVSILLIHMLYNQTSGVPGWFIGSGSGTDFTLRISRVEAEDAGVYYCQQTLQNPPTVVQPWTQISSLWVVQLCMDVDSLRKKQF